MKDDILVSVICLAYNHEKYIRECLDSIVCQKTDFKFEIIVQDDVSSDKTVEIIKEYADKYPDIIIPLLHTENQYSKYGYVVFDDVLSVANGKYIAFCECDDFWCDENKLQMQVNILKKNPDCHICVNKVGSCKENGEPLSSVLPSYKLISGKYEPEILLEKGLEFQLSGSMFVKDDFADCNNCKSGYFICPTPTDTKIYLYFISIGKYYYSDVITSVHRSASIGSWSENQSILTTEKRIQYFKNRIELYKLYDEFTNGRFAEIIQMKINKEETYLFALQGKISFVFGILKYRFSKAKSKELLFLYLNAKFPKLLRNNMLC